MIVGDFMRAIVSMAAPNLSDGAKMVWDWQLVAVELPVTLSTAGEEIVDAIIARYYEPLADLLSTSLVITQVEIRAYGYAADGYIAAGTLWSGNSTVALLPPANALAIQLIRSNFTMRNGRKAYPGATVINLGQNGDVSTTGKNLVATVTDGWASTPMNVELSEGNGATFGEVVITAPVSYDDPVIRSQAVLEYSAAYWGTQNSRK